MNITFKDFIQLMESIQFATPETSKQSEKAISDINSIMFRKGYKKSSHKSMNLTKYIYTDGKGREITVDELWGENKAILNMFDNEFKGFDFSEFTWNLGVAQTHEANIKKIIQYLKEKA